MFRVMMQSKKDGPAPYYARYGRSFLHLEAALRLAASTACACCIIDDHNVCVAATTSREAAKHGAALDSEVVASFGKYVLLKKKDIAK
jgi:hypothetical protein